MNSRSAGWMLICMMAHERFIAESGRDVHRRRVQDTSASQQPVD